MKNLIYILFFFIPIMGFPQGTPQGISYQAVAYDSDGFELSNQDISVRLGILLGSVDAEDSYTEVHSVTTDDFGMFSLVISQGETSDTFSSINWEEGAYLKVEVDEDLDGEYNIMGVSSFNAVPYALYAETTKSLTYEAEIPNWIYDTGLCSDNLPEFLQYSRDTISNGNMTLSNDESFCDFTLNEGDTLFIEDHLILRVAKNLIINGVVTGYGYGNACVSGGSGGALQTWSSSLGLYQTTQAPLLSTTYIDGIFLSENGSVIDTNKYLTPIITNKSNLAGSRGGGSYRYSTYLVERQGLGAGGAGLVLICNEFSFNGIIDLSGDDGEDAKFTPPNGGGSSNIIEGASGGGAGGSVIINAKKIVFNTGDISLNGGLGGGGGVSGNGFMTLDASDGGNGFVIWLNQ